MLGLCFAVAGLVAISQRAVADGRPLLARTVNSQARWEADFQREDLGRPTAPEFTLPAIKSHWPEVALRKSLGT